MREHRRLRGEARLGHEGSPTPALTRWPSGAEVRAPAGSMRTVAWRMCVGQRARVGPQGGGPSGGAKRASSREEQQAMSEHLADGLHACLACL